MMKSMWVPRSTPSKLGAGMHFRALDRRGEPFVFELLLDRLGRQCRHTFGADEAARDDESRELIAGE